MIDPAPPPSGPRWFDCGLGCAGILAFWIACGFISMLRCDYRRTPSSKGMMHLVKLPALDNPLDRIHVSRCTEHASGILIHLPANESGPASVLHCEIEIEVESLVESDAVVNLERSFDMNGDGLRDLIECGIPSNSKVVRVVSGSGGTVLFEQEDPLEYEHWGRGFAVGDLDGDGCHELALVHPRTNRSYDFHPGDSILGVHSWVTVISGAEACTD